MSETKSVSSRERFIPEARWGRQKKSSDRNIHKNDNNKLRQIYQLISFWNYELRHIYLIAHIGGQQIHKEDSLSYKINE